MRGGYGTQKTGNSKPVLDITNTAPSEISQLGAKLTNSTFASPARKPRCSQVQSVLTRYRIRRLTTQQVMQGLLISGRFFTDADTVGKDAVAIIDETFATAFGLTRARWGNESVLAAM
jgi:hypothetical protein